MDLYQQQNIRQPQTEQKTTTLAEDLATDARNLVSQQKQLSGILDGGLNLSGKEYAMITTAMSQASDPNYVASRFAQALVHSKNTGISLDYAYQNLEALNKAQMGRDVEINPSGLKSIMNSFRIGKLANDKTNLSRQFRILEEYGGDTSDVQQRIAAIEEEMASLQDDVPRNIFTQAVKLIGENWAYMGKITMTAAMYGGAAALIASGIGIPAGTAMLGTLAPAGASLGSILGMSAIYSAAATAGSFKGSADWSRDNMYYDLRAGGVDKNTAQWASGINSWVQGAIETFLGTTAQALGTVSGLSIGKLANGVATRLHLNGITRVIAAGVIEWAKGTAEEGLEELLQGIADNITKALAYEASGMDWKDADLESIGDLAAEFAGGALMGGFLGIPSTVIRSTRYAKKLKNDAVRMDSKEAFIEKHMASDESSGFNVDLSEQEKRQFLSDIYDKNHNQQATTSADISDAKAKTITTDFVDINEEDPGTDENGDTVAQASELPVEPVKRLQNGRLRVQESKDYTVNSDGSESHKLKIGSVGSGTLYGTVEYTLDGKDITIDKVTSRIGYENIQEDAVKELMRRYEGYNISWNPETDAQQAIRNNLIKDNPLQNGQLNWFDGRTDIDAAVKASEYIQKIYPNMSKDEATVATQLLQIVAETQGQSTGEWIKDHFQNFKTIEQGISEGELSSESAKKRAATVFDESGVKAIIYTGKEADFSTFTHETFHVLVRTSQAAAQLASALREASHTSRFEKYVTRHPETIRMSLEDIQNAIDSMGDNPLEWTRAQHEVAAHLFESYLQEGRTFSEKLQGIFQKIADWFTRIYNALRGRSILNDEIVKAYDEILAGNPELQKAASVETENSGDSGVHVSGENVKQTREVAQEDKDSAAERDAENGLSEDGNPLFQDEQIPNGKERDENIKWALTSAPVYEASDFVFEKTEQSIVKTVGNYYKQKYDGFVLRHGQKVLLDERSVRDSLGHIGNPSKYWASAFAAMPDVIRNGKTVGYEKNWKGRGYDSEIVIAPISVKNNQESVAIVVVKHYHDDQPSRFYLHRTVSKKSLLELQTGFNAGLLGDNSKLIENYSSVKIPDIVKKALYPTALLNAINKKEESSERNSNIASSPDSNMNIAQQAEAVNSQEEYYQEARQKDLDAQYEEIRNKYYGTDQWMKAPNGQPTNLNERQWVQVRTPAFKAWFGDWEKDPENSSKMLDTNGEPIVFYHGSYSDFDTFERSFIGTAHDSGFFGEGFYFAFHNFDDWHHNKGEASYYGSIVKAFFLNIRNPFDISEKLQGGSSETPDLKILFSYAKLFPELYLGDIEVEGEKKSIGELESMFSDIESKMELIEFPSGEIVWKYQPEGRVAWYSHDHINRDYAITHKDNAVERYLRDRLDLYNPNRGLRDLIMGDTRFSQKIREMGYDGIIQSRAGDEAVVFDSNQIKSATENNGAFSIESPNTLYQDAFHGTPAVFEEFDTSHVGEGEGSQVFGWGIYLSDSKSIARDYGRRLARKQLFYNGEHVEAVFSMDDPVKYIAYILSGNDYSIPKAKKELKSKIAGTNRLLKDKSNNADYKAYLEYNKEFYTSCLQQMETNPESFVVKATRNLYSVSIPDDDGSNYLYWDREIDKPALSRIYDALYKKVTAEDEGYSDAFSKKELRRELKKLSNTDGLEGRLVYGNISAYLGSDKDASKFLSDLGYVGINYPAGTISGIDSKKRNYVVFKGTDITILENTLFQDEKTSVEQEMIAEAKYYDTVDEYMEFVKAMDETYGMDDDQLRDIWMRAHGMIQDAKPESVYVSPIGPNLSEDERDVAFRTVIQSDEGITAFVDKLRQVARVKLDADRSGVIGATTEEEFEALRDTIAVADEVRTQASPFIWAIAKGTKDLSDESIKKIRTTMDNEARAYRDLYARVMGDENFSASDFGTFVPDINEPGFRKWQASSIAERRRMAEDIEAQELADDIRSGREKYDGTAEKIMKLYDRQISELNERLSKLQGEYDLQRSRLNAAEKRAVASDEEIGRIRKAINRETARQRNKLDAGNRISTEEFKRLKSWEERLDLLNEEVKDIRKQDSVKATIEKREALAELKAKIREKEMARRQAKRVHDYKLNLANSIVTKPSASVNYEQAQRISAIAALVDPNFRRETVVIDGRRMTVEDLRAWAGSEANPLELSDYLITRITKKSLGEWTVSELEQMAEQVNRLREEGRQIWQAKVDARAMQARNLQNQIIDNILSSKKYKKAGDTPLPNSVESIRKEKVKSSGLRSLIIKTLNMDRKAQMLDNGMKGPAFDLLVREKREAQNTEYSNKRNRIRPLEKQAKELGVKTKDLYETVPVSLEPGLTLKYTYSDLVYGLFAQKEQRNYMAFAYGDLVSQEEKMKLNHDNVLIQRLGDDRNKAFVQQAKMYLDAKPQIMRLAEAYEADLQAQAPRIHEVMVREYNQGLDVQNYYMPIYRKDFNGTDIAQKVQDDLFNRNAGKSATTPGKGFTKSRIDISPDHQMRTTMDYFSTWAKSMEDQEHLIANVEYVRKLNRVFKNIGSKDLQSTIEKAYGRAMKTDLDNYINEVANPVLHADTQEINSAVRVLRGGLYTAYLGFKTSGIVLQAITSPMPFLQEVGPVRLAKALLQMTFHPKTTWKYVTDLSPMMENRSMNPMIDEINRRVQDYSKSKVRRIYDAVQDFGTQGLEMIDRWAVTAGWLAVYEKEMEKAEYQSDSEAMAKAARHADEVVYETQPTGDITEMAPMFKSKSEFAKAFTQFQVSLNVIWNNYFYDMPKAFRAKEFRKAIGILFGYTLAGALLTAVQDGFKGEDGDEPEAGDIARQLAYGATTQFTSGIPLLGSQIDNLIEALITGRKPFEYQNDLYPGINKILSGATSLVAGGDVSKALLKIGKGIGLQLGIPTSGISELKEMLLDDEWQFTFKPGALLGRRDY